MKRVYFQKTRPRHYTAQAFVVRCFDDRFRRIFENFLKHLKIRHADFESVAGGAKLFSSPETVADRDFMLRELAKSIRLHHTKRVMLFTHADCRAYGGSKRFGNETREASFHVREHKKARVSIAKRFPKLKIDTYFVDWRGIVKTS